jgi:hypothetical protein
VKTLRSAVLLVCATLTGCAADAAAPTATDVDPAEERAWSPPVFARQAVNVDQVFSDAVEVDEGSLAIPTSMLGEIQVGSIVAGDRATKGTSNPYGFLRRVTKIETHGDRTTLTTEKAAIADWLYSGRIDFSSRRSLLTGRAVTATGLQTRTLHLRDEGEGEGGGSGEASTSVTTTLEDKVSVSNASMSVKAGFDGYFDVRRADVPFVPEVLDPPNGAGFEGVLTIDPSVGADITWTISNTASMEKSWKGADVVIPIAAPIPLTVRYAPELECNVSASGEASFTVGANVGAHAVVGFQGDAGLDHIDTTNLSQGPSFTGALALKSIQGKATVSTECQLLAVPELLAFDTVGISGSIGPYVSLTATACANANAGGANAGFTLVEDHGVAESFSGRVQIPLIGQGTDFSLWEGKQSFGGPSYIAGDEHTCDAPSVDSCAGKADGFYCSEVAAYGGIVCQGGQIMLGLQCDPSQKCAGGTASTIECR